VTELELEIARFLDRYIGYSRDMDFDAKRACWDADEPTPVLAPEESLVPHVGWGALERYWNSSRAEMSSLSTTWSELVVTPLTERMVVAAFKQTWTATLRGTGPLTGAPIAATVRANLLLRRSAAQWRIVASVEAHVDGAEYFLDLYRRRVAASAPWN
jgi:hypothetical protein